LPRTIFNRCRNLSKQALDACLDLFFPPYCVGCNLEGVIWCRNCIQEIDPISGDLCPSCGLPLLSAAQCSACRSKELPFQARSYAWYRGPLCRALVQLKYRPDRRLSDWLAIRLVEIVSSEAWPSLTVIPVPLSQKKFNRRGYNQVDLIASAVARKLGRPYRASALRRTRDTRSQVGLSPAARKRNVQGAFKADSRKVNGKNILIIDDLYTTGATLLACTQALKDAGAGQVFALTAARANHFNFSVNTLHEDFR
jgi:competence protein ComFC